MTRGWRLLGPRLASSAATLVLAVGLAACTANAPKAPPPPIQTPAPNAGATLGAVAAGTPGARAPSAAAPVAAVSAPPTMPALISQTAAEAPAPPVNTEGQLPTGRELAAGMVRALNEAKTARL